MIICCREKDQVNSMLKLEIMREYFVHLKRFEIVKTQGADFPQGKLTRWFEGHQVISITKILSYVTLIK